MTGEQAIDTNLGSDEHKPELNKYFRAAIKTQASDLHLKVGQPPKLRLYGQLKNTTGEIITEKRMEELVFEILTPAHKETFLQNGTLDFAYGVGKDDRYPEREKQTPDSRDFRGPFQ